MPFARHYENQILPTERSKRVIVQKAQEQKEHQLLSRELAEEGRDIRSVDSSRDVRVETLSDAGDKGKDAPR